MPRLLKITFHPSPTQEEAKGKDAMVSHKFLGKFTTKIDGVRMDSEGTLQYLIKVPKLFSPVWVNCLVCRIIEKRVSD